MSKTIYIVYETTNTINGKYYIGVHKQNGSSFDGYLGSGKILKRSINKYGKENFFRSTIKSFDDKECAYLHEKEIITKELINNSNCYNIKRGGSGGWMLLYGSNNHFYNKHHTKNTINKIKTNMPNMEGKNNPFYGKTHSNKSREKIGNRFYPTGQTHPSSKLYRIIFPDNHIEIIKGLSQFCRDHNLGAGNMRRVMNGEYKQHKGFKCQKVVS